MAHLLGVGDSSSPKARLALAPWWGVSANVLA